MSSLPDRIDAVKRRVIVDHEIPERAPLVVGAQIRGAIEMDSPVPHLMSDGSLEVLETLATHAAAATMTRPTMPMLR